MRSTLEIIIAVQESQPATEEELRLALLALSGINHFIQHDLDDIVEAITEQKPFAILKMKAEFSKGTRERLFQGIKKDPREWLGPGNTPGNPEYESRRELAKKVFKRATGVEL